MSLRRTFRWPAAIAVLCTAAAVLSAASQPRTVRSVDSMAAPDRDHFLFVGVDLYVVQDNQLVQVQAFDGDHARITKDNGETASVERTQGFKWRMNPKISPLAATIAKLNAAPVFSPTNDPNRNWASQQLGLMDYYGDQVDRAHGGLVLAEARAQGAQNAAANGYAPQQAPEDTADAIMSKANSTINAANAAMEATVANTTFAGNPASEADAGAYDAIELTFQVSAPQPIADAYVVAITRLRTDKGFLDINFQRAIGPVGPTPRKVTISQAGLPKGFTHLETKLHLFNHGEEIATNLSERRVDLTADEARDYVMLDYVSRHRGATVPASPVWALAPEVLRAAQDPRLFDFSAEVEVDAEGKLVAVRDAGDRIMPAQVRSALEQFTYVPALENGVPVTSTVRVNPADYFK